MRSIFKILSRWNAYKWGLNINHNIYYDYLGGGLGNNAKYKNGFGMVSFYVVTNHFKQSPWESYHNIKYISKNINILYTMNNDLFVINFSCSYFNILILKASTVYYWIISGGDRYFFLKIQPLSCR